jgi:IS605 OrfB family transposase
LLDTIPSVVSYAARLCFSRVLPTSIQPRGDPYPLRRRPQEGIGTLVVGKNLLWKQEVNLGRVNNQHFIQLPHARFIDLLTYKAELAGIAVVREARKLHEQGKLSGPGLLASL